MACVQSQYPASLQLWVLTVVTWSSWHQLGVLFGSQLEQLHLAVLHTLQLAAVPHTQPAPDLGNLLRPGAEHRTLLEVGAVLHTPLLVVVELGIRQAPEVVRDSRPLLVAVLDNLPQLGVVEGSLLLLVGSLLPPVAVQGSHQGLGVEQDSQHQAVVDNQAGVRTLAVVGNLQADHIQPLH
mgnify:CR=1 FL=1